jgi:hypothetical protein
MKVQRTPAILRMRSSNLEKLSTIKQKQKQKEKPFHRKKKRKKKGFLDQPKMFLVWQQFSVAPNTKRLRKHFLKNILPKIKKNHLALQVQYIFIFFNKDRTLFHSHLFQGLIDL